MRPQHNAGRVRIDNNNVVSSDGAPLRGAPIWVYGWGKQIGQTAYATDPSYYQRLIEAGLNAIRLVCFDPWQRSNGYPHWDLTVEHDRVGFFDELDRVVAIAIEHGLNVIINYHNSGEFDLPELRLFWQLVAPRYADQPLVCYELVNEPVAWSPAEFTPSVINDMQIIYQLVRQLAPATHLILLSLARIATVSGDRTAIDVAKQMTEVDWSNASVGFHLYGISSSSAIIELKAQFPVINTEMDLPCDSGGEHNSTPIDGERYGVQTMERLAISWCGWNIDGVRKFERYFVGDVLQDAREKGYLWDMPLTDASSNRKISAIAGFFTDCPVGQVVDIMRMKRTHIAAFILLSLIAAVLDGLMLTLLIPISFGLAAGSFSFMNDWPGVGWLNQQWPMLLASYTSAFLTLATVTFLIGVIKNVVVYALHLLTAHFYGYYSTQLASFLFGRFLTFGKAYFDRHNPGELSVLIDYHHQLLNLFQGLLRVLTESLTLFAYLAVMLLISWRLTLVALLVFPVVYAVRRWIAIRISAPSEGADADSLRIAGASYSVLTAIPLYQSFSQQKKALHSYRTMANQLRSSNDRIWRYRGLIGPVQDITMLLALLTILTLAFIVEGGSTQQATAMFVFFFVARLAIPRLSAFHEVELEFSQILPRVRQLLELLSDEDKYIVPEGSEHCSALTDGIEFRRLTFRYPDGNKVLREVSMRIEKGEMTALVGASGAGKSTLTSLLVRFYDTFPGQLLFDGSDIRNFSVESVRDQIALVNQEVILLNDSLRNNLTFGLKEPVSEAELNQVLIDAQLVEMVASLDDGLDAQLGDRGLTLSGGQRQRVAIARALLRRAPILILDEATSALDSQTEQRLQAAIEQLVQGCTSLVIAHRLSTIQRADKVVVLKGGRVVETGTLRELLDQRGLFYDMWQAQKFD